MPAVVTAVALSPVVARNLASYACVSAKVKH